LRNQLLRSFPTVPRNQSANSIKAILLPVTIQRFRQTVGVQKNRVAVGQCQAMNREARVTKHSQRHTRRVLRRYSIAVEVKEREMSRADKLHRTIECSSSHD